MRIVDFKTFIIHHGYRSFVFLKLYADDGTTGVGEGTIEWNELAAEACIRQTCTRIRGPQEQEARRSRPRAPGRPVEGTPPGLRQRLVLGLPDTR